MNESYAAGLIDGEGYLGIAHVNQASTYTIRVQVAMVTKGSPVLSRMHSRWGGRMTVRPPETERNAAKDVWVLDGQAAYDFLTAIRPYLILKTVQADCCTQLWEAILESRRRRGRHHWDDGLRRHARHLMLRLQESNQRGPESAPPVLPAQTPLAVRRWGEWWEPDESLFGPVPFTGNLPTSGRMIAGRIYSTGKTSTSLSSPGLLPTPNAADGMGGPGHQGRAGGLNLRTAAVQLLPTPTSQNRHGNDRNSRGELLLPGVVRALLPTPTAADAERTSSTYERGNPTLIGALTDPPSDDGNAA